MQDTEQVDLDRRSAGAVVAAMSFSTRRIVLVLTFTREPGKSDRANLNGQGIGRIRRTCPQHREAARRRGVDLIASALAEYLPIV